MCEGVRSDGCGVYQIVRSVTCVCEGVRSEDER